MPYVAQSGNDDVVEEQQEIDNRETLRRDSRAVQAEGLAARRSQAVSSTENDTESGALQMDTAALDESGNIFARRLDGARARRCSSERSRRPGEARACGARLVELLRRCCGCSAGALSRTPEPAVPAVALQSASIDEAVVAIHAGQTPRLLAPSPRDVAQDGSSNCDSSLANSDAIDVQKPQPPLQSLSTSESSSIAARTNADGDVSAATVARLLPAAANVFGLRTPHSLPKTSAAAPPVLAPAGIASSRSSFQSQCKPNIGVLATSMLRAGNNRSQQHQSEHVLQNKNNSMQNWVPELCSALRVRLQAARGLRAARTDMHIHTQGGTGDAELEAAQDALVQAATALLQQLCCHLDTLAAAVEMCGSDANVSSIVKCGPVVNQAAELYCLGACAADADNTCNLQRLAGDDDGAGENDHMKGSAFCNGGGDALVLASAMLLLGKTAAAVAANASAVSECADSQFVLSVLDLSGSCNLISMAPNAAGTTGSIGIGDIDIGGIGLATLVATMAGNSTSLRIRSLPQPSISLQSSTPLRHLTALRLRQCALDGEGLKVIALALGDLGQNDADVDTLTRPESCTSDSGSKFSTSLQMLGCLDLAYNPQLFAVCAAASAFSGDSASDADGFASEGSDDDGRSTPSGTTQKDTERFALAFGAAVGSAPALISLNLCCTGLASRGGRLLRAFCMGYAYAQAKPAQDDTATSPLKSTGLTSLDLSQNALNLPGINMFVSGLKSSWGTAQVGGADVDGLVGFADVPMPTAVSTSCPWKSLLCLDLGFNALGPAAAFATEEDSESHTGRVRFGMTRMAPTPSPEASLAISTLLAELGDAAPSLRVLGLAGNGLGPTLMMSVLRWVGSTGGESEAEVFDESIDNGNDEASVADGAVHDLSVGQESLGRASKATEILESLPPLGLTALDLSSNALNDTGARALATWLSSPVRACPLRQLVLDNNAFSDASKRQLATTMMRAAEQEAAAQRRDGAMSGASPDRKHLRKRVRRRRLASACRLGSTGFGHYFVRGDAALSLLALSTRVDTECAQHVAAAAIAAAQQQPAVAASCRWRRRRSGGLALDNSIVDLAESNLGPSDAMLVAATIACSAHCERDARERAQADSMLSGISDNAIFAKLKLAAVRELNLSACLVGIAGLRAILSAARVNHSLTSINLSNNLLGPGPWNRNRTTTFSVALQLLDLNVSSNERRDSDTALCTTAVCNLDLGANWLSTIVPKSYEGHVVKQCPAIQLLLRSLAATVEDGNRVRQLVLRDNQINELDAETRAELAKFKKCEGESASIERSGGLKCLVFDD